tara:strand:+ start:343 stop:633 length:291 start_codon:yes stop_codon:yes gene_type:complete
LSPDETVILARLEAKLDSHAAHLEQHCDMQDVWQCEMRLAVDGIDEALRGNGKPGVNMRLDRVEQREVSRGRLLWVAIAAVVGGWVKMLFQGKGTL